MVTLLQRWGHLALRPSLRPSLHPVSVVLCLVAALACSTVLVSPAEARAAGGRSTTAGWSTSPVVLDVDEREALRVVVRGAKRAGRTVVLQRRSGGQAWSTVDQSRTGRRGHAVVVVRGSAAYDGQLRVVVPAARGARGVVTAPRGLVVRAATAGVATGDSLSAEEREVVRLVNEARAVARTCGNQHFDAARPLRADARLSTASRGHARDMGEKHYFSHESADGRSPWRRAEDAGYRSASGENIAAGQRSPAEVVGAWLDSDGHCANIMSADARDIGVGLAVVDGSPYGYYWVQMFGRG